MMLPKTKIVISQDGSTTIEGMEQSPQCGKLLELAKLAGKIISEKKKDHSPVHNTVIQKGK